MNKNSPFEPECFGMRSNEPCDKIWTPYAKIFSDPTERGDYWNIHYLNPTDGKIHIGFGSYKRENVEGWLKEHFEVYDSQEMPTIDAALNEMLRELAEIIMTKYPDTVHATITLEAGSAELSIKQCTSTRYAGGNSRKPLKVEG